MIDQGATRRQDTTSRTIAPAALQRPRRRRRRARPSLWLLAALAAICLLAGAVILSGTGRATVWWLTNTQPPTIEATAPSGPHRGTISLPLTVVSQGRADLLAVTMDGALPAAGVLSIAGTVPGPSDPLGDWWSLVQEGRSQVSPASRVSGATGTVSISLDTTRLPDGTHTLQVTAQDRSRRHNQSTAALTIRTDNTPPTLTLSPVEPRVAAGRPVFLRVAADEPATLHATWGGEPLPLVSGSAGVGPGAGLDKAASFALAAVPVETAAGERTVQLDGQDEAGNAAHLENTLKIDAINHPRQVLEVPPELAPLATGPVASAESAQLAALTATVRPERLWRGPFQMPVPPNAPRTTGFGERRDYADGFVTYHAGYDLAVPLGTPVPASADGVVVFAGQLAQRGNCVVLDHGWGVYTVYAHLSQIGVQVGQTLAQGQILGLVGTTGLSTGPHLHWEVRLRGLAVDPNSWLALSASEELR